MPYSRNSELPPGVKSHLPATAQTIYRNAFNAVYDKTESDGQAAKAGWAAVKRAGYRKKGDTWARAVEGFLPTAVNLGSNVWEVQWSAKDVLYTHPDFGTIRLCPQSFARFAESAKDKPTTLNHTEQITGKILDSRVENDVPIVKFQVTDETNAMMEAEGWNGGVSPVFFPARFVVDSDGIADYIVTEWGFESLGIGDGSQRPACPQGVCAPKKVEGMAGDAMSATELAKAKAEAEAARAHKAAETEAAKKAAEATEAEGLLKDLKATATEDTMKVFEKILDTRLKPIQEENVALKEQLKKVTTSEEEHKKFKEAVIAQEREALINGLPADTGIDYKSKDINQLREMASLAKLLLKNTAPPPAGAPQDLPEADGSKVKIAEAGGRTVEEIRAYNQAIKDRYRAKPKQ